MANAYILNQVPTGYGQAMSLLAEMLVAAGWSYKASGDGLTGYNATGKVFTGTSSGALGWNNTRAWARLADPANGREIVMQHNAAGGWRFKYSAASKFTAGTPSATVTPSAADERVLWGSGTDATPTMSAYWSTSTPSGLVKYQGAALDAAGYGFWMCGAITPAGAITSGLMLDPVGSVVEDTDPCVWHIGAANAFSLGGLGSQNAISSASFPACGGTTPGCWGHMDVARTKFLYVMPAVYSTGSCGTGVVSSSWAWCFGDAGLAVNPFSGKYDALPILYARNNVTGVADLGLKGWSTMMRWTGVHRTTFTDTLDSKKWICLNYAWLPWDGVTTPTN